MTSIKVLKILKHNIGSMEYNGWDNALKNCLGQQNLNSLLNKVQTPRNFYSIFETCLTKFRWDRGIASRNPLLDVTWWLNELGLDLSVLSLYSAVFVSLHERKKLEPYKKRINQNHLADIVVSYWLQYLLSGFVCGSKLRVFVSGKKQKSQSSGINQYTYTSSQWRLKCKVKYSFCKSRFGVCIRG